jgi:hypothetical protein
MKKLLFGILVMGMASCSENEKKSSNIDEKPVASVKERDYDTIMIDKNTKLLVKIDDLKFKGDTLSVKGECVVVLNDVQKDFVKKTLLIK